MKDVKITKIKMKELKNEFLNEIKDQVLNDGKVSIRNFGTFMKVHKNAHIGRNPMTGEKINVPEKDVIKFRPSVNFNKIRNE